MSHPVPTYDVRDERAEFLPFKNKFGNLQGCKTIGVCGGCAVCGEYDADQTSDVW